MKKKINKKYSSLHTSYLNNMNLLFEEIIEHSSVKQHFNLISKPTSIGDCIREFQKRRKIN